jgi:hypothetical protein
VWFEFGLAIAFGQEVCIVCVERREKFPFDIQHRKIIRYKTDAPDDFAKLQQDVTDRLKAIVETRTTIQNIEERIEETTEPSAGLSDLELLCIGILAGQNKIAEELPSVSLLYSEMERAGYLPIATSVALRRLARRGYVDQIEVEDNYNNSYRAVRVTQEGWQWIEANLERFTLKTKRRPPPAKASVDMDDEIPF